MSSEQTQPMISQVLTHRYPCGKAVLRLADEPRSKPMDWFHPRPTPPNEGPDLASGQVNKEYKGSHSYGTISQEARSVGGPERRIDSTALNQRMGFLACLHVACTGTRRLTACTGREAKTEPH